MKLLGNTKYYERSEELLHEIFEDKVDINSTAKNVPQGAATVEEDSFYDKLAGGFTSITFVHQGGISSTGGFRTVYSTTHFHTFTRGPNLVG